jgi:hypothetical protein
MIVQQQLNSIPPSSINQMKAENPQLNVSEVSFARGKAGKNSFGKRTF